MRRTSLALALLLATTGLAHAADSLTTVAERSGFQRTGRYDEVIALCQQFAQRHAEHVRCTQFGTTPEGRPMHALVASRDGVLSAEHARELGRPVVLIQGGIHAGEIDGKDAGFLALRELLGRTGKDDALAKVVLVFVPVFNVDGHERFGRWNRPNQRGPEEMGWRTTAQNYNLNRDYAKADAPEMQAMLALVQAWDPLAVIDLHVTDGAQFEHDVAVMVEPVNSADAALRASGRAFRDAVVADLAAQGSLPLTWYPSFVEYDNPESGVDDSVAPPRFSTGYFPLRNRFSMLVETHSWKDYPTRVRVTRNLIHSVLQNVAEHGAAWQAAQRAADERSRSLGGTTVPLAWRVTDKATIVDFRGYAYTRTPSEVSGALMTRYDESKPQVWKLPVRMEIVPALEVAAPRAGYFVSAADAALVGAKLRLHGITFRTLDAPLPGASVESFRATKVTLAPASFENHQRLTLEGEWKADERDIPARSLFVPIAQPKARLAMALLEPRAPDSLTSWGFFNAAFEQKEYMEPYVAEQVAREMLARDPALKAAFDKRLAEDAAFAADAAARLQFFHERHSSWDERLNLVPVLRTDVEPQ